MALVVNAPNFTQIPNEVFDAYMKKLTPTAFCVLMVIFRKTVGWHKMEDAISLSQLTELTGMCRNTVLKGVNELSGFGYITQEKQTGRTTVYRIELIVVGDSPTSAQSKQDNGQTSVKSDMVAPKTSVENAPTKEIQDKEKKEENKIPGGNRLVTLFHDLFMKEYHEKPFITKIQAVQLHNLGKRMGEDHVERKLRIYFATSYWFTKAGRDISSFIKFYNSISSETLLSRPDRFCTVCGEKLLGTSTLCKKCGADN